MCFCATHHAFEHDTCVIIPLTVTPPKAYVGSAILENRKDDECEDKADYDVHGVVISVRVNKINERWNSVTSCP